MTCAHNLNLAASTQISNASTYESPHIATSGINLVPVTNLVSLVNRNLKDCASYPGHPLKLVMDQRIGLSSNLKLVCDSCDKMTMTSGK